MPIPVAQNAMESDTTSQGNNAKMPMIDWWMVETLLNKGAGPNALNAFYLRLKTRPGDIITETLLMYAVQRAEFRVTETHCRHDPNLVHREESEDVLQIRGDSCGDSWRVIKMLLDSGANANATDPEQQTALHWLMKQEGVWAKRYRLADRTSQTEETIGRLMLHGCDSRKKNKSGDCAFAIAARQIQTHRFPGKKPLLKVLIDLGIGYDCCPDNRCLTLALETLLQYRRRIYFEAADDVISWGAKISESLIISACDRYFCDVCHSRHLPRYRSERSLREDLSYVDRMAMFAAKHGVFGERLKASLLGRYPAAQAGIMGILESLPVSAINSPTVATDYASEILGSIRDRIDELTAHSHGRSIKGQVSMLNSSWMDEIWRQEICGGKFIIHGPG